MKSVLARLVAALLVLSIPRFVQAAAPPGPGAPLAQATGSTAEPVAPPKKVIAFISAVGDQLTVVRQRPQVGSNREPYRRTTIAIPGDELNAAVLRGLDRAVSESEPGSERLFIKLNAKEMQGIAASDRERVAIGKIAKALETFPGREQWDRIIAVTPAYVAPERQGMGSKLHGIGIYVQPLEGPRAGESSLLGGDFSSSVDEQTVTPSGAASRSSTFVAPFFYTRLWILDPRTLKVIESEGRYDYRKLFDPEWTALDVAKNLPPDQLATEVVSFTERASARAVREALGVVTISDPKPVTP